MLDLFVNHIVGFLTGGLICNAGILCPCSVSCMRKPTIWDSNQVSLYSHRRRLEAWNFRFKKKRDCTIPEVKTKVLISFTVTMKLVCIFVFSSPLRKYRKSYCNHPGVGVSVRVAQMLKFLVKVFISLYLLNMVMDQVDTLHISRYWSEVLCSAIMTHPG